VDNQKSAKLIHIFFTTTFVVSLIGSLLEQAVSVLHGETRISYIYRYLILIYVLWISVIFILVNIVMGYSEYIRNGKKYFNKIRKVNIVIFFAFIASFILGLVV
jgi:hypothetical protein